MHTCIFLTFFWDNNKMAEKGNSNNINPSRLENRNKDDRKGERSHDWECGDVGGRDSGNVLFTAKELLRPDTSSLRGKGFRMRRLRSPHGQVSSRQTPSMYREQVDSVLLLL